MFLRVRADDRDWAEPQSVDIGEGYREFSFCSEAHYTVVVACNDFFDIPSVYQLNGTLDEVPRPVGDCGSLAFAVPTEFLVTGIMNQPGSVAIGDHEAGNPSNVWTFEVPVSVSGVYDVVSSSDSRVSIHRAVTFEGPTDLGTIDHAIEGVDLTPIDLIVADTTPMTTYRTTSSLQTSGGTTATIGVLLEPRLMVPPPKVLLSDDHLTFSLSTGEPVIGGYQRRGVANEYMNDMTSIDLPPRLSPSILPVAPDLTLALASLPTLTNAWVTVGLDDHAGRQMTVSTPGWIAATGATEVSFDVPSDLDPKWLSPGGLGSWVSLDAYEADTDISRWTVVSLAQ